MEHKHVNNVGKLQKCVTEEADRKEEGTEEEVGERQEMDWVEMSEMRDCNDSC